MGRWGQFAVVLVFVALAVIVVAAQRLALPVTTQWQPVGDAQKGRGLIAAFGCGSCHTVPGIPEAMGRVGPRLSGLSDRAYIAGRLPNTPENLARWIVDPQGIDPGNAMPNLKVTPEAARDMAAYLYTLR